MIEAVTKLIHKDDYETPPKDYKYICENYNVNPIIDACATKDNAKCLEYITPEMDLFKQKLKDDFWMNAPYRKKGWQTNNKGKQNEFRRFNYTGIEDFIKFAHDQHFLWNVTGTLLLFSNISSSDYFKRYIGETPQDRIDNEVEVYFYPNRINFLDNYHRPTGIPAFSSLVAIYREQEI